MLSYKKILKQPSSRIIENSSTGTLLHLWPIFLKEIACQTLKATEEICQMVANKSLKLPKLYGSSSGTDFFFLIK